MRIELTRGQEHRTLRYWQRRLRLQDWKISLYTYEEEDLSADDQEFFEGYRTDTAYCEPFPEQKVALISLAATSPPETRKALIVHELVHILLSSLLDSYELDVTEERLEEQIVNQLTDGLLNRRGT